MRRRRFLIGTGAAAAGTGLLVGAGAFTRTESQRNVTVEVVGDDDAYLRLVYADLTVEDCGATVTIVTIGNQLKHAVDIEDVDLSFDEDHLSVGDLSFPDRLEVGEQAEVTAEVTCDNAEAFTSTLSFTIDVDEADLGGVIAEERTIEVGCACPTENETAWAYGGDKTAGVADDCSDEPIRRIDGHPGGRWSECVPGASINTRRWGWYLTHERGTTSEATLYAGAGSNDLDSGTAVGTLTVEEDGDDLLVTYDVDAPAALHLAHLYVGPDVAAFGDTNAAPGQFPFANESGSFTVDLAAMGLDDADDLVIAGHGEVALPADA